MEHLRSIHVIRLDNLVCIITTISYNTQELHRLAYTNKNNII
jgi:hypothetical protein